VQSTYASILITRGNFEVYHPAEVTLCTNGVKFGVEKSTPTSVKERGVGPSTLKILHASQGHALGDFIQIFRVCGSFIFGKVLTFGWIC